MNPMQILDEALSEGKNFASAAGRIRDKFKSGAGALKDIEAEAEAAVDAAVAKAKDGLAAFKAEVEKVEKEAEGEPSKGSDIGDFVQSLGFDSRGLDPATASNSAAVIAETGAPAEHVEPAVQAHADAIAAGSPPEVAHADAQAAAAAAGAEPEVAAQIADSVATQPTA